MLAPLPPSALLKPPHRSVPGPRARGGSTASATPSDRAARVFDAAGGGKMKNIRRRSRVVASAAGSEDDADTSAPRSTYRETSGAVKGLVSGGDPRARPVTRRASNRRSTQIRPVSTGETSWFGVNVSALALSRRPHRRRERPRRRRSGAERGRRRRHETRAPRRPASSRQPPDGVAAQG